MYSRAIVRSVQVLVSATSDRAMLVGQACQDVPRTRYSLSPLSLSVSCVFPSCLLSFTGQEREVFLGPRAPLTVLDPSATLMSLPGSRGKGGGPGMDLHTLFTLFHDGLGRASGREGGWTLCWLCPTRPHPSPFFEVVESPLPSPKGMALAGGGCIRRGLLSRLRLFSAPPRVPSLFLPFSLPPLLSFLFPSSCQSLFSSRPSAV